MLSTRDPLQNKGHIQTKSEGLEKKYFMQTETKRFDTSRGALSSLLQKVTMPDSS